MSRRAKITGTYRMDAHEVIQVTVDLPNAYPDAIAEAKATVLAMLHEQLADVLEQQYGKDRAPRPADVVWPEGDE